MALVCQFVGLSTTYDRKISTIIRWTAVKKIVGTNSPYRMETNVFGDPLTFHLLAPRG